MKRILLYSFALLSCFASCDDSFLDVYPETSISNGSFYKTADHFDQALIASYEKLRTIALSGMFMDEMRSDNTFYTMYSGDRGPYLKTEVIALFLDDETTGNSISDRYNADYSAISRINTLLGRMDASALTDSEKTAVKAEALFLRAFYYFDLVTHWGGVPLMLKEVTTESEAFIPNSTIEEVYTQIQTDIDEAITLGLPVASSFPQSGRATMGAAKMLRAYVYMTKPNRNYPAAEQDLLDITKMNYQLAENYEDAFDPGKKNSRESIFEVQYLDGDGEQHNDIPWRMIPKCSNLDFLMGINANNYAYTSGGWNVPTQEMIESYESGDKRLNVSIAVAEGIADAAEQFTCEAVKEIVGFTPTTGKDFRYFVKKYFHPPYSYALKTGDNFPVYRYSGALLLLAECLVEQGKNGEALPWVNKVRERAGLPALPNVTAEDVAKEMRHELAFENHRWTDLIRTGKAIEVMTKYGVETKKLYPWILSSAFNITSDRLIYPFYYRELQVNEQLKQNPGYKDY